MAGYRPSKKAVSRGRKLDRMAVRFAKRRYLYRNSYAPKIGVIARDVARLKGMLNTEKKYVTFERNSINFGVADSTTAPDRGDKMQLLLAPTRGDAFNERTGQKIKITSMEFQVKIQPSFPSQFKNDTRYKIYVLQWIGERPPDLATDVPSKANSLTDKFMDLNSNNQISVNNFRNRQHFKNWRILKVCSGKILAPTYNDGAIVTGINIHDKKMWVSVADPHQVLNNSTSATQFPQENPLYILYTADNGDINTGVGAQTGLVADIQYRINYLDN